MEIADKEKRETSQKLESLQTLGCDLSPIVNSEWHALLAQSSELLPSLLEEYGSPLHLVAPEILNRNLKGIQDSIRQYGVKAPFRPWVANSIS